MARIRVDTAGNTRVASDDTTIRITTGESGIQDSAGSVAKNFALGDNIRDFTFSFLSVGGSTATIDTTGFDKMLIMLGDGDLSSSGTTTVAVRYAIDSAASVTGSITAAAGVYAPATVGTTATSRTLGYLLALPHFVILNASGGADTDITAHVQLRKTNTIDRGR